MSLPKQELDRHQSHWVNYDLIVADDSFVRVVDAFVDSLDLASFGFKERKSSLGASHFPESSLLKLYIYGSQHSVDSARKLANLCKLHIEYIWLMKGLQPKKSTIAEFRITYSSALPKIFDVLTKFLQELDLIGGETVAIDGSKFSANNSRKNNHNRQKIERQLKHLDNQVAKCESELSHEGLSQQEQEALSSKMENLQEKQQKQEALLQELENKDQKQVSTTDEDARLLAINSRENVVGYNVQTAVDAKHKLIVGLDVLNTTDRDALSNMTIGVKNTLGLDELTALGDSGYNNAKELAACHQAGISTLVAPINRSSKSRHPHYTKDFFTYDESTQTVICPAKQLLTSNGKWYDKKNKAGEVSYQFQKFSTDACADCPFREQCLTATELKKKVNRIIPIHKYQAAIDKNKADLDANKDLYKTRQAIVEHPFGTIKRNWGKTYTYLKGLKKVKADFAIVFTAYNLRRATSILGVKELISRLIERYSPFFALLGHFWRFTTLTVLLNKGNKYHRSATMLAHEYIYVLFLLETATFWTA